MSTSEQFPQSATPYPHDQLQTAIPERFDLIPAEPLRQVALVLGVGAVKYGEYNWKQIPVGSHLNHAEAHINRAIRDHQEMIDAVGVEDDIIHAICRLIFAWYLKNDKMMKSVTTGGMRNANSSGNYPVQSRI